MSYPILDGLRVVDFGIITAGASTSALLADLGAEVIKVEGPTYIDPFRTWTGVSGADKWWNESPHYAFTNRNKRNVCVDLKHGAGKELVLDLIRKSDIVVENFRVGALDRLGLGFAAAAAVNPNVIFASIASQGATGPDARSVSFGSTLEASSGLSSLIRSESGAPLISGHALNYPDQIVSMFALSMILSAVIGQADEPGPIHLDISQRELTAYMLGERFAARAPYQQGTGSSAPAVFETVIKGIDEVCVAVSVATPEIAVRLTEGLPLLVGRSGLEHVAEALRKSTSTEILELVRSAGGAAERVRTARDLLDPETADSLAYARDPYGRWVKGLPWRVGNGRAGIDRAAPGLGQDNEYVMREILGLAQSRYEELVEGGVLATEPKSKAR